MVNTPQDNPLVFPTREMAMVSALEFDSQVTFIRPHTMTFTNFAFFVLDVIPYQREEIMDNVKGIARFDNVCARVSEQDQPGLVRLQHKHWDPLLKWFEKEFNAPLHVATTLRPSPQPAASLRIIDDAIEQLVT